MAEDKQRPGRAIRQRPETVRIAAVLVAVGGFLDAYTFLLREVFANAQSGNVVLMMISAARADWTGVLLRVPSVVAYFAGLAVAQLLATGRARVLLRHPARWVIGLEAAVLIVLGIVGAEVSTAVLTATVSFTAALQASTFDKVGGLTYNTTMTTGNIRSLVAAVFAQWPERTAIGAANVRVLVVLVIAFPVGAAVGALTTSAFGSRSAWLAAVALIGVGIAIALETRRLERRRTPPGDRSSDR